MKLRTALLVFSLFSFIFLFSCSKKDNSTGPENGEPTFDLVTIGGQLKTSIGSTITASNLSISSFAAKSEVSNDGSFTVDAVQSQSYQVLLFQDESTNNPVYMGLFDPTSNQVTANDTSTALSLALFNPLLIYSDHSNRSQYLQAVKQSTKFSQLINQLNSAYQTNAANALDYTSNPLIYQTVVQIMKEAMESLGGGNNLLKKNLAIGDPPYIEDRAGADIAFINDRHVWYGAGIYQDNSLKDVKSVDRKHTIVEFNFGWPPVVISSPAETAYSLGDGDFKIYMAKGLDFSKITNWNDPVGRATLLNSGEAILYIIEILIGNFFNPDIAELPNHFHISLERSDQLTRDLLSKNPTGFLTHFLSLIADNSEELAYWIFQEYQSNAAHQFLNTCANVFSKVTKVLELFGYVNEQGPFVFDLIFAPKDVTYYITQTNGIIQSSVQNESPVPEFTISPAAGIIGTTFTFDASSSSDDNDILSQLQFRWDWESDGIWDVNWSSNYTQTHSYSESGAYLVTLEAKDSQGQTTTVSHTLNVGGGAGSASHVKLFRDNLPWDSNALEDMLESLGFTYGTGPNTYEIITSDQIVTTQLIPGEDLVIIANDQNQTFYNNYAYSQTRFTNFVYNGGSLFWEACDQGWANGSISSAGIVLPGNLETDFDYDYYNYIPNLNLPLVSGLPGQMDHNYASHESFSNIPDGTTIYCINEEDEPTLIEFNFGLGWIIVTGQPLEHQYDNIYGSNDMEELLPRIVAYFTGKSLPKTLPKRDVPHSTKPSYLNSNKANISMYKN